MIVADDSAVMRRVITRILESEPGFEVIATAKDGMEVIDLAAKLRPDVITMDVNMPRLDGLRAVETIMGRNPIPIVLLSAFARPGGKVVEQALAHGVVHIVQKPSDYGISLDLDLQAEEIRSKVRSAAHVRVVRNASYGMDAGRQVLRTVPNPVAERPRPVRSEGPAIVAIGASTGGTVVIGELLSLLPRDFPSCVLIVQHMPPGYTADWARTLSQGCALAVAEARHGDFVAPGKVFIAPGGHHMEMKREHIALSAGPRVKMHRPSVDVLFDSLLPVAARVYAVLLTGMGDDGVGGMMRLHAAGAATIAQDQATAVVWGMPGAAVRAGCVERQLPADGIARYLIREMERPAADRSPTALRSGGVGRNAALYVGG